LATAGKVGAVEVEAAARAAVPAATGAAELTRVAAARDGEGVVQRVAEGTAAVAAAAGSVACAGAAVCVVGEKVGLEREEAQEVLEALALEGEEAAAAAAAAVAVRFAAGGLLAAVIPYQHARYQRRGARPDRGPPE